MSEIFVHHVDKIEGHPVCGFLTEGYLDLMNQGFAPRTSTPPINWDNSAFYIEATGWVVAAMSYTKIEWKSCLYVNLGYVDKQFRRQGLYSAMWRELVKKAVELKVCGIESSSHLGNVNIERFNQARGRRAIAVTYRYDLDRGDS